jgi:hypothetical protein
VRCKLASWVRPMAVVGLSVVVAATVSAQDTSDHGLPVEGVKAAATNASRAVQPYDWQTSFAKVKTGKVPRTPDGHPDLQGIWSHSILTPLERPANAKGETEVSADAAQKAEDAAHQRQVNLRVEPTDTPPGEKTTDAYNAFWRDGYWFKVPMTTLHTSQVVDPPDGRVPPLTPEGKQRMLRAAELDDSPATGPEDRPLSTRRVRPMGVGPAFTGSGPGGQETTLQIIQSPKDIVVRVEALDGVTEHLYGRPPAPSGRHSHGDRNVSGTLGR